jgi:hypothetical protein
MNQKEVITPQDLGPGLEQSSATKLTQVALSTKAGQALTLDEQNRLYVPAQSGGTGTIPITLNADLTTAVEGQLWTRKNTVVEGGFFAGFLGGLPIESVAEFKYFLTQQTPDGLKRVELT